MRIRNDVIVLCLQHATGCHATVQYKQEFLFLNINRLGMEMKQTVCSCVMDVKKIQISGLMCLESFIACLWYMYYNNKA